VGSGMRLKGWERRFRDGITDELERPYDWVSSNCGHLVCAAVRACHGEHVLMDHLANGWRSKEDVLQYLYDNGSVSKLIGEHFELLPSPMMAQNADIGVYPSQVYDEHAGEYRDSEVGMVILDGMAVGKTLEGPFRVPIKRLSKVFRV
jgi:hypothetical protein